MIHRACPFALSALLTIVAAAVPRAARAEPGRTGQVVDITALSLNDLLNTPVSVVTRRAESLRDTPGVVTVITRAEIRASGARDLTELLALVPGFALGADVVGIVGIGVRGMWAHEGKVLLLVDGQEMNERLYSTTQLGNHYPLELIERIEIMRGPGSVVYGGYAELAVIHIITRSAADLQGYAVAAELDGGPEGVDRLNGSAAWGQVVDENLSYTIAAAGGRGQRSAARFTDFGGRSYGMDGQSGLQPVFVNAGATIRDLRLRLIYDDYRVETRDGYTEVLPSLTEGRFRTLAADATYTLELTPSLVLTPRVHYQRQTPWQVADRDSPIYYDKTAQRYLASLELAAAPAEHLDLVLGAEEFLDRALVNGTFLGGYQTLFGEQRSVAYHNTAVYGEAVFAPELVHVVGGARYEINSEFGSSLVPRLALTRTFGDLHLKALYSRAFRAPGIENINLGQDLVPERTSVIELEAGYALGAHLLLTVDAFDITLNDPIVYMVDEETGAEGYRNFGRTGSRGVELDLRFEYGRLRLDTSYSFYTPAGRNDVKSYAVPGRDDVLLAFPAHKVAFLAQIQLLDNLTFAPSAIWTSARYGYLRGDGQGNPALDRDEPHLVLNGFLDYRDVFVRGLALGLGVHDALNTRPAFIQPYDGGHAPLPGRAREVSLRASFERAF